MLNLVIIILAILAVSAGVAIYRMIKTGVNLQSVGSVVFALLLLFFATWLYMDIQDFEQNFSVKNKQFIFVDDGKVITGFSGVFEKKEDIPDIMTNEEVAEFQKMYDENNWDELLETNYKVFVVNEDAFSNASGEVIFMETLFSSDYVKGILYSDSAMMDVLDSLMALEEIPEEGKDIVRDDLLRQLNEKLGDDTGVKAAAFAALVDDGSAREGQMYLLKHFQTGDVRIIKETIVFKLLKFIPPSYMDTLFVGEEQNETQEQ